MSQILTYSRFTKEQITDMEKINYEIFRDGSNSPYFKEVENNECWLHFHRNMEMLYVVEGEMKGTISGKDYAFSADDIVFIPNYYSHTFSTPEYSKVIILVIPYDIANDFQDLFKNSQFAHKLGDKVFNRSVLDILKLMQKHYDKNSLLFNKGCINSLIGLLMGNYQMIPICPNHNLNLIIDVLEYIDKNYYKKLTLSHLAQTFGYNKDYFSKVFNKCVGINLNAYINRIRIENALNIIKKNYNRNIVEISMECGFDSAATFYRTFQNFYHKTPLEYLKDVSNN